MQLNVCHNSVLGCRIYFEVERYMRVYPQLVWNVESLSWLHELPSNGARESTLCCRIF